MIRAQDGHNEFRLNWNVYNISVNYEFSMKCMQKMDVVAKIRCYFSRSVVTLKLHKEYLNIFCDIQYTSLTLDKKLNSLIYTGWAKRNRTVFRQFVTPVYVDVE